MAKAPGLKYEWLLGLCVCLCLALLLTFVSENLSERFALRAEIIAAQFASLAGAPYVHYGVSTYYPPFQNRVLFPAVFAAFSQFKFMGVEGWFLTLRAAFAAMMFGVSWVVFRRLAGASVKQAAAGCFMLAYGLVFTFNFKWEHTSDYPDAMFTMLMIAATLTHSELGLGLTALLAATNRESAAFAGVFWICMHGIDNRWQVRWREVVFATSVSAASYAAVLALRFAFGGPKAIESGTQLVTFPDGIISSMRIALDDPGLSAWPVLAFAMLAPVLGWIALNRGALGGTQKRLLLASLLIAALTTGFGFLNELRILIPSLATLVFVATWAEALPQAG